MAWLVLIHTDWRWWQIHRSPVCRLVGWICIFSKVSGRFLHKDTAGDYPYSSGTISFVEPAVDMHTWHPRLFYGIFLGLSECGVWFLKANCGRACACGGGVLQSPPRWWQDSPFFLPPPFVETLRGAQAGREQRHGWCPHLSLRIQRDRCSTFHLGILLLYIKQSNFPREWLGACGAHTHTRAHTRSMAWPQTYWIRMSGYWHPHTSCHRNAEKHCTRDSNCLLCSCF